MTGKTLKLKDVRLAFSQDMFVPRSYQDDPTKAKKHRAKFLMRKDHPQLAEVVSEITRLANEEWKEKATQVLASIKGNAQKFAFSDGDLSLYEGFPGNYCLSASRRATDGPPDFRHANPVLPNGKPNIVTAESGVLYSGCFVNAYVSFWTFNKGGPQMNLNLLAVQFLRKGEAFTGGGATAISDWENEDKDSTIVQPASAADLFT